MTRLQRSMAVTERGLGRHCRSVLVLCGLQPACRVATEVRDHSPLHNPVRSVSDTSKDQRSFAA